MAEAGGVATQSGIYYQNSIAALFLGRLLDPRTRTAGERVVEVRVEAPAHVDDIVVLHADGNRSFIQAKEALSSTSDAWGKVWAAFAAQAKDGAGEQFRLVLAIGTLSAEIGHLRELCGRAQGKRNHEEWFDSLSSTLKAVSNKIVDTLSEKTTNAAFQLVKHVEVWIWPLDTIERDMIPLWIPPCSTTTETLFELLLSKIGGKARIRGLFHAAQLLDALANDNKVSVHEVPGWGTNAYLQTIRTEMGVLNVPGTKLSGPIDELFLWIPLRDRAEDNAHLDFEEEDPRWRWSRLAHVIDMRNFPRGNIVRAVIDAGAGFGKTSMLHAIAYRLSAGVRIPALIALDALAASNVTVLDFLIDKVNTEYNVSIDWERLCESGRAVVLLDGLDELSAGHRTNALNKIGKFAARFPLTAFLLTVRDSAALTVPLDVPVLSLNRLDDFSIGKFADAYARHGGRLSADVLSTHLRRHPDLGHLLRIPLFLALVLASVGPEDDLPHSRAGLLEHYLSLLFSPERHKAMAEPLVPLADLREAAELLSWYGLKGDGIGLSEIEATQLLRRQGLSEQPDVYIERLLQIGVLRRAAARLRFAYPIVQEYLAARWMVTNAPKEIGARFAYISRRPWAQALQFALEMHPDAGAIISSQLNAPDDAFNTTLRLIGRCIVNGASVSSALKRLVGDRLAEAWPSESHSICESIGYLLADGFLDPLPSTAIDHISRWALHSGGAEIVVAKALPSLTRIILKSMLASDMSLKYHLHGWQVAVDDIADEALDLYLDRVRDNRTTAKELESLSSLIVALSSSRMRANRWQDVATNLTLPLIIRLAGYQLAPRPVPSSAWLVIDDVLRLSESDDVTSWANMAFRLFWRMEDAEAKYIQMLNDAAVSEKRIRSILEGLLRSNLDIGARRALLRHAMTVSALSPNLRFLMLLCLAIWGDKEAEGETIPMLSDQQFGNVLAWLRQANKFSEQSVRKAALVISSRQFSPKELLQLIGTADFGLSYNTDMLSFDSAAGNEPYVHAARAEMINSLIASLRDEDESFESLNVRVQSGDTKARERLISEMRTFLAGFQGFMPFDEDLKVDSALYILLEQGISLPFDLLLQIVGKSSSNAGSRAVSLIARRGEEGTILKLVEIYNSREQDFVRDAIFSSLESIAGRYGKRIVQNGDRLCIEQQPNEISAEAI